MADIPRVMAAMNFWTGKQIDYQPRSIEGGSIRGIANIIPAKTAGEADIQYIKRIQRALVINLVACYENHARRMQYNQILETVPVPVDVDVPESVLD